MALEAGLLRSAFRAQTLAVFVCALAPTLHGGWLAALSTNENLEILLEHARNTRRGCVLKVMGITHLPALVARSQCSLLFVRILHVLLDVSTGSAPSPMSWKRVYCARARACVRVTSCARLLRICSCAQYDVCETMTRAHGARPNCPGLMQYSSVCVLEACGCVSLSQCFHCAVVVLLSVEIKYIVFTHSHMGPHHAVLFHRRGKPNDVACTTTLGKDNVILMQSALKHLYTQDELLPGLNMDANNMENVYCTLIHSIFATRAHETNSTSLVKDGVCGCVTIKVWMWTWS